MKFFTKSIKFYLLILATICWNNIFAQNSTCATAAPLMLDVNCVGTTGGLNSGDPTGNNDTDENVCSTLYSQGDDYIFEYTATSNNPLTLDLFATNPCTSILVTEGCPTTGTCFASSVSTAVNESLVTPPMTVGVTYYIQISTDLLFQSTGQFCLNATTSIPLGSTCMLAVPLTIGANCVGTTGGFNSGDPTGYDLVDGNICSASFSQGDDYLFEYTATNNDSLRLDLFATNTWTGLMVTEGCPTTGTCFASSLSNSENESLVTPPMTIGVTYYIHISTFLPPQSAGQFCLNASLSSCFVATAAIADFTNCPDGTVSVSFDISDMGSSSILTVTNDAGGTNPTPIIEAGTYSITGVPPVDGGTITITLTPDDDDSDMNCPHFLTTNIECPPQGATCHTAMPLVLDTNCSGTTGGLNSGDPTGNDFVDGNVCNERHSRGDDFIYEYTATSNLSLRLILSATNTWTGVMVTEGCPTTGTCFASSTSGSRTEFLVTPFMTSGVTYYIHISTSPESQSAGQFCLDASLQSCYTAIVSNLVPDYTNCSEDLSSMSFDLLDMGSATSITVTNDVGGINPPPITSVGTYTITDIPPVFAGSIGILFAQNDSCAFIERADIECPPQGATCQTAIPLILDSNCMGTTGGLNSGDPTGNDLIEGNVCSASYSEGDDYLFEFTATSNFPLQLDLFATNGWTGMMITEGCPTTGTCFASVTSFDENESLLTPPMTSGVTYYIHISTFLPNSAGQFCLNAAIQTCYPAIAENIIADYTDCPTGPVSVSFDVIDMGSASTLTVTNNAGAINPPPIMEIGTYSILATPPVEDEMIIITLTPDDDDGPMNCTRTLTTTTTIGCPPPSASCQTAVPLVLDTNCVGTIGGLNSGDPTGNNFLGGTICTPGLALGDDYIYEYTATNNFPLQLDLFVTNSEVLAYFNVTEGCPTSGTCFASSDFSNDKESLLTPPMEIGVTYYIHISSYFEPLTTGPFCLNASNPPCYAATVENVSADYTNCPDGPLPIFFEVTDMGSATTLTVTNDAAGINPPPITEVGTYSIIVTPVPGAVVSINLTPNDVASDCTVTLESSIECFTIGSNCVSAKPLILDDNCVGTIGGLNTGDPTGNDLVDGNDCNSSYSGGDDYLFEYTATSDDSLQLDLFATNTWTAIMVTEGCPTTGTCFASSTSRLENESLVTPPMTSGVTYYIQISTFPEPQSAGEFCLNASTLLSPLPIELTSFTGKIMDTSNLLEWTTASEENTEWHIIERSKDGRSDWIEVGRTKAKGFSNQHINYQLRDEKPMVKSYYRLRSVDFDDYENYSEIIYLERKITGFDVINIYPVPTSKLLNIDFETTENQQVEITLIDMLGKMITTRSVNAIVGINTVALDMGNLANGVYFITINNGIERITKRVIKN